MGETAPYRRTWRVTVLRGLVACVPALALAALFASTALAADRLLQFGQSFALLAIVPGVWLVLGGAWIDHRRAARGPVQVLAIHLAGSEVAVWLGVFASLAFNRDAWSDPFASDVLIGWISVLIPLWVAVGFLVAWLVPGSFPSRDQWVPSVPGVAQPLPPKLAQVEDANDAH